MRRTILLLGVLVLVLGWLAPSAAAGPATRPFKVSLAAELTFPEDPSCTAVGLRTHSEATGTATHLGRTLMVGDHCTPPGEEWGPDYTTLTAADGSQLFLTSSGTAQPPVPGTEGSTYFGEGEFEVTGGTGRFEGATGEGDMTLFYVFAGFEEPVWPAGFVYEGSVTY